VRARVTGIGTADADGSAQVALPTDLRPIKAVQPTKYGLAVDSAIPIGRIDEVDAADSAWKRAEQVILSGFSKLEAEKAYRIEANGGGCWTAVARSV